MHHLHRWDRFLTAAGHHIQQQRVPCTDAGRRHRPVPPAAAASTDLSAAARNHQRPLPTVHIFTSSHLHNFSICLDNDDMSTLSTSLIYCPGEELTTLSYLNKPPEFIFLCKRACMTHTSWRAQDSLYMRATMVRRNQILCATLRRGRKKSVSIASEKHEWVKKSPRCMSLGEKAQDSFKQSKRKAN